MGNAPSERYSREELDGWAEAGRGEKMERHHLPTAVIILD
jgi:hypothetical protein